jgi:hypothetical protein
MPEVPAVPHRKGALTLVVTHRFLRRGYGVERRGQDIVESKNRDAAEPLKHFEWSTINPADVNVCAA